MTRRDLMNGLLGLAASGGRRTDVDAAGRIGHSSQASQDSRTSIPPNGIGRRIRHVSYSDQGGRPDGVQIMVNRRHVYVGHMFNDGVTILDAADPRRLKPVGFFTAGSGTRTHHLQVADDVMLLANGANIVAMQSYDNMRGYFENNLAVVVDEANAEKCAKGTFYTFIVDVRAPENPVPISTLPTPRERDFCSAGVFGPPNVHENRPGSTRNEETIF